MAPGGSQGVRWGHQPSTLSNWSLFNSPQTPQTPAPSRFRGPPACAELGPPARRQPAPEPRVPKSSRGGTPGRTASRSRQQDPRPRRARERLREAGVGWGGGQEGHVPGQRLSAQATRRPRGRSMARGAAAGAGCGAAGAASQSGSLPDAAPEPALRARRARRPDSRRVQRKWEGRAERGGARDTAPLAPGPPGPLCHRDRRRAAPSTPPPQTPLPLEKTSERSPGNHLARVAPSSHHRHPIRRLFRKNEVYFHISAERAPKAGKGPQGDRRTVTQVSLSPGE